MGVRIILPAYHRRFGRMELSSSMRILGAGRLWPKRGFVMSVLISVLVTFLVIILVLYLVHRLPIDGRAKQIVRIIVIVIGVLSLLKYIAVF